MVDQRLGPPCLGLAARQVALDHALDVVDVAEHDPFELRHGRIDVARHRDVDQEQGLSIPRAHHGVELVALDDVVRRVRRRDDDVGALELGRQLVEAHGMPAEALREADRAVVVAVGDEHRR